MKTKHIVRWMGAGLVASGLTAGCNHVDPQPVARTHRSPASVSAVRPASQPIQAQVVQTVADPPLDVKAAQTNAGNSVPAPGTDSAFQQTGLAPANFSGPQATPPRRSFVDTTAQPCFSHAPDYGWLCGQVQISRLSKGVRLRYASVDEVDPYGGSVTLVEDVRLAGLKDSQCIRVTGHLLNPEVSAIAPLYQIDSIQSIDKRD